MDSSISLPVLLKRLYDQHPKYDAAASARMMQDLKDGVLAITDLEIGDEDIDVICHFLNQSLVLKRINKLQIDRSSGKKSNNRRPDSALHAFGGRLFREIIRFIVNSKALQSITFESIFIPKDLISILGKSMAASSSIIQWVGFRECDIHGDEGMRLLTPYLGKLSHLQVLGLERCSLTDTSIAYIASILKAQESNLDSSYWNATLRTDLTASEMAQNINTSAHEVDEVYRRGGLVAVSLCGNFFQGRNMFTLTRVLRHNHWLLGLNLANNRIISENLTILAEELNSNDIMQALLLKDNLGFNEHTASTVSSSLSKNLMPSQYQPQGRTNSHSTPASAASKGKKGKKSSNSSNSAVKRYDGPKRMMMQPPKVALLLQTWSKLGQAEVIAAQLGYLAPDELRGQTRSPLPSTGSPMRAFANKDGKGASAAYAEMQLEPIGYSIFDFDGDEPILSTGGGKRGKGRDADTAPISPYRRGANDSWQPSGTRNSKSDPFSGIPESGIKSVTSARNHLLESFPHSQHQSFAYGGVNSIAENSLQLSIASSRGPAEEVPQELSPVGAPRAAIQQLRNMQHYNDRRKDQITSTENRLNAVDYYDPMGRGRTQIWGDPRMPPIAYANTQRNSISRSNLKDQLWNDAQQSIPKTRNARYSSGTGSQMQTRSRSLDRSLSHGSRPKRSTSAGQVSRGRSSDRPREVFKELTRPKGVRAEPRYMQPTRAAISSAAPAAQRKPFVAGSVSTHPNTAEDLMAKYLTPVQLKQWQRLKKQGYLSSSSPPKVHKDYDVVEEPDDKYAYVYGKKQPMGKAKDTRIRSRSLDRKIPNSSAKSSGRRTRPKSAHKSDGSYYANSREEKDVALEELYQQQKDLLDSFEEQQYHERLYNDYQNQLNEQQQRLNKLKEERARTEQLLREKEEEWGFHPYTNESFPTADEDIETITHKKAHSSPSRSTKKASPRRDDSVFGDKAFMKNFSTAMHNLEHVSGKLKDVADALSESMALNLSIQKDMSNSSFNAGGGISMLENHANEESAALNSAPEPIDQDHQVNGTISPLNDADLVRMTREKMEAKLRSILMDQLELS